jgi:hypothetical protein
MHQQKDQCQCWGQVYKIASQQGFKLVFKMKLWGITHGHFMFETHSLILTSMKINHWRPCFFIKKFDIFQGIKKY